MNAVRPASCVIASALLSFATFNGAIARVTNSKVLCFCASPADIARTRIDLELMVSESRSIGKVVVVVITNVANGVASVPTRDNLRRSSMAMLSTLQELGIKSAESYIEFVEASPSDHGCKDAALAVNVEFIYDHQ